MTAMYLVLAGFLGTAVGSFLNVLIYRIKSGENIVHKRSHCRDCGHTLRWYELLPILSFAIQRAHCRHCGAKISWQYPAVEIATVLLFLQVFSFQPVLNQSSILEVLRTAFLLFATSGLVVIFVYDLKHYLIPDVVLFPLIGATLFARLFGVWTGGSLDFFGGWKLGAINIENLVTSLVVGIAASAFFFALFSVSRGSWMGFGDVKLAFFMGLLLGYPYTIVALFLAFLSGAIMGLALISLRMKKLKSQVPFAPFLIFGAVSALFWGQEIINWYLNLFL